MNATVNTHNLRAYRLRGHQPDGFDYERSDNRSNSLFWAGLMGNDDIIGPIFFDNVNGEASARMIDEEGVPVLDGIVRYRR